jgi:hypothetical protein
MIMLCLIWFVVLIFPGVVRCGGDKQVRLFLSDEQLFGHKHQTQFTSLEIRDNVLDYMLNKKSRCEWITFSTLEEVSTSSNYGAFQKVMLIFNKFIYHIMASIKTWRELA